MKQEKWAAQKKTNTTEHIFRAFSVRWAAAAAVVATIFIIYHENRSEDCVLFLCVTSTQWHYAAGNGVEHIQCTMYTNTYTHAHKMNTKNRCFMSVLLVRFNKNLWTSISIVLDCFFLCMFVFVWSIVSSVFIFVQ